MLEVDRTDRESRQKATHSHSAGVGPDDRGDEAQWPVPSMVHLDPSDSAYDQMEHEEFLTFRLSILSAAFDRKAARRLTEKFGLSLAQRRVLGAIVYYDAIRFGELVKHLSIDGGQISRAASELVNMGLVRRVPDKSDGRSAILVPTSRGKALDKKIIDGGKTNQRAILSNLSSDERVVFYRSVGKLLSWLDELERKG